MLHTNESQLHLAAFVWKMDDQGRRVCVLSEAGGTEKSELDKQHRYRLRSRGRARKALLHLVRAHLKNKENTSTGNQNSLLPLL